MCLALIAVAGFNAFPPVELPSMVESFLLLPLAWPLESFLLSLALALLLSLLVFGLDGMMKMVWFRPCCLYDPLKHSRSHLLSKLNCLWCSDDRPLAGLAITPRRSVWNATSTLRRR